MSRPVVLRRALVDVLVAGRLKGRSWRALAAAYSTDSRPLVAATVRRAVLRDLGRRREVDPFARSHRRAAMAMRRGLLEAAAASRGMSAQSLAEALVDVVLRDKLVAAVLDGA